MNKFKLFVENMLVYGLGGIISKIIPIIMLPIITFLLPGTNFYGLSDMTTTIISLGSALAVMGMYDAMYRLFFDKKEEEYRKDLCSTTLFFTLCVSIAVALLMVLLQKPLAKLFFMDVKFSYLIYVSALATLVGATNSIISAPTRMQNKRKVFLVTNTVGPVISYAVSIPMILNGFYIMALPVAAVSSSIILELSFAIMNRKWFSFKRVDFKLIKPLLAIAVPLIPNFLIYWVFNSCDKLMITNIIGLDAQGIYAVSSKLGHISQLIYTAFAGGWQFFAFSTMNEKDQVKNNSLVFEYLGAISYVASAFICVLSPVIFLLFKKDYYEGFISAPYLFLAPLLLMLFQVACNQFIVVKKTWPNVFILSAGAIFNVVLNYALIPRIGIEGASIATLSGYILTDIIVVIVLSKMKLMLVTKRLIASAAFMSIFFICWRLLFINNLVIGMICAVLFMMCIVFLYRSELRILINMVKNPPKKGDKKEDNKEEVK